VYRRAGGQIRKEVVPFTSAVAQDRRSSRYRHILGFGAIVALVVFVAAMIASTFASVAARKQAEAWHVHTLEVLLVVERVRSSANEALRGERGYLITGDERFLEPYHRGARDAPKLAVQLAQLTRDNAEQQSHVVVLRPQLDRYLAVLDRAVRFTVNGDRNAAVAVVRSGTGRREIEQLLAILARIEAVERKLLDVRRAETSRLAQAADRADLALAALALLSLLIIIWAGITASRARKRAMEMQEQLRRAATTDELTGLVNRRAFLEALDTELARSARSGAPLALALIDLDHFKSVNDRFGHHGGDAVLRRFAEVARGTMRAADVIGRIGGEEFAVLMPDTNHVEAGVAGERLRNAIARQRIVLDSGALVPVTASIGVAHRRPEEDRDRLMLRADEALYEAKDGGRNRTRLAA
jgi:diguanylate cyclase (GGDEF)-like protein